MCVNDNSPSFLNCRKATRPRHTKSRSNHAFKDKHKLLTANQASAIGDSGTTHNLLRASHVKKLAAIPCADLHVTLPNGAVITSTHVGKLPLANSQVSTTFYVFSDDDLQQSLLSFSALCNEHDCVITLTRADVSIRQGSKLLFHGTKSPADTLWHIDLDEFTSSLPSASCNNAYKADTDTEFVAFVHACFGYPTQSTFLHATRMGWLSEFPRLTAAMVSAHPPHAIATAQGHLDQSRQVKKKRRGRSTRARASVPSAPHPDTVEEELFDDPDICVKTYDLNEPIHADLTAKFPVVSRKGNQYLLVACWHGYCHFEPMPSRTATSYVHAYTKVLAFFRGLGHTPTILRLDNETSGKLEAYLKAEHISMQFVPPGTHRANKAERHIRTSKNHLISILNGVHSDFPLYLWDDLVPQAEITLAHLMPYTADPTQCAYDGLHPSRYDFVAHPIAPCGTLVVVHDKPSERGSWAPHGVKGYYLGPALQHHHCWRTWIISTQAERITDTVEWFPEPLKLPGRDPHALVTAALRDLTVAVQSLPNTDPARSAKVQSSVTSATAALRAVIDLFDPPSPPTPDVADSDSAASIQRVSSTVDPVTVQRVSERSPDGPTSTPVLAPPSLPTSSPLPVYVPPVVNPTVPRSDSSQCLRLLKRGPPAVPAGTSRVPRRQKAVAFVDPTVISSAVPVGPPTTSVPPESPTAAPAPVVVPTVPVRLLSQRTRRSSRAVRENADRPKSNGHKKPNYRPNSPVATTYSASDAARASAARAYMSDDLPPPNHVCRALSRVLGEANAVLNLAPDGSPLRYKSAVNGPNSAHWKNEEGKEICKLVDTATMHAIHSYDQPVERKKDTTYYNPQVKEKPGPTDDNDDVLRRVRGTIGGDRINYPGAVSARTADMEVVKILLNSVVSTNANWMTIDIVDYYLGTPLPRPEYLRIPIKFIPDWVIAKYSFEPFIATGSILFEVNKGMYGLPQAGKLAQERLCAHLLPFGYAQDPNVPCLFKHESNGMQFTLVVDDFGIKYFSRESAEHLIACLEVLYPLKVNWTGHKYLGMNIDFAADRRSVTLSMPGYVRKQLLRFSRRGGQAQAKSPTVYVPWHPRSGPQFVEPDESAPLTAAEITEVQEIVGCFLWYARVIDSTFLPAVNIIGSEMVNPTQHLLRQCERLLAYAAAYPDNVLVYRASDMVLEVQTDASYLSRSRSRSVAGGIGYLGSPGPGDLPNGAVVTLSSVLDVVVASAGKRNMALCSRWPKKPSLHALSSSLSAMLNLPLKSFAIMSVPTVSPTTRSSNGVLKVSTCAIIGSEIAFAKVISRSPGDRESSFSPTSSQRLFQFIAIKSL